MPAIPPAIRVTDATSRNDEPVELVRLAASWRASAAIAGRRAVDRVVGEPRPRRVAASARGSVQVALTLPRQPGVHRVVGRLHHDHEVGGDRVAARASSGVERALGDRQLLAPEEQAPRTARRASASSIITASAPFMSLAPRPCTRSPSRRPGRLPCAGTVSRCPASSTGGRVPRRAGEHAGVAEVAHPTPPAAQDVRDAGRERRLVARLGGDVDELERPRGEALRQLAVVAGRGHGPRPYNG